MNILIINEVLMYDMLTFGVKGGLAVVHLPLGSQVQFLQILQSAFLFLMIRLYQAWIKLSTGQGIEFV